MGLRGPAPDRSQLSPVEAKGKKWGLGSVEEGTSAFLVILQFYFHEVKVTLPLKSNFKIQKTVESLASFFARRFPARACTVREWESSSVKANPAQQWEGGSPRPLRAAERSARSLLYPRLSRVLVQFIRPQLPVPEVALDPR